MKDFLYLKVLDRLKGIFTVMGIDYPTMRRILRLKLVMNRRRSSTVIAKDRPDNKNTFFASLGMYAFLGLFIGIFMFFPFPLFLKMNIVLGMIIFIILTTMISDFSSVLLDIQDKAILLTRPVDAKTFGMAKLLYIVYYLFSITIAISGIALVAALIKHGPLFFLAMLAILILICSFTILFTSILYFAVLRLFSGEKLKDIINYFQIALSVFMTVAYQLIGRIFNFVDATVQVSVHWWNFLLPSSWFAAPFCIFFGNDRGLPYILLAVTGVVIPVIALILYVKVAAPAFERNLQKLASGGGAKAKTKKFSLMRTVSGLVCYNSEEKAFFRFTCGILKNERKLKLRLFPNLTLGVIMPFVMIFSFAGRTGSFRESLSAIAGGSYHLFMYISLIFFATLFSVIATSENFRGAWIYRAMPIQNPAPVLKGALKAFVYKYSIPFYLLTGLIFTVICGVRILPDLVLIFVNMMILMLVMFKLSKKELPFSRDFQLTQGASNLGLFFLSFIFCGVMAGAHYLLSVNFNWGLAVNLGISLIVFIILWMLSFRFRWADVVKAVA